MEEKDGEVMKNKFKTAYAFVIQTTNGMAYGLFATLIIGTIIGTIGSLFHYGEGNGFCDFIYGILGNGKDSGIALCLQYLTGAGIGIGIALTLKFDPLKTIVMASVGEIAAYLSLSTSFVTSHQIVQGFKIGDDLFCLYHYCVIHKNDIKKENASGHFNHTSIWCHHGNDQCSVDSLSDDICHIWHSMDHK